MVKLHKRVCEEWSSDIAKKSSKIPKEIQQKKKSPMTVSSPKKYEETELKKENSFNSSKKIRKNQSEQVNRPKVQKPLKQQGIVQNEIKAEEVFFLNSVFIF